MFKTKSEVDKHVGKIFLKAKTDSEKNRECFKIARLYFGIKEYENAKMYLAEYLSELNSDPLAWKLMAEITELHEKNMLKSIDFYSKSYDLNPTDKKILLKICFCYMNTKEKFDSKVASEWLEKLEQEFPYEKQVIEFKERLFSLFETSSKTQDWEQFLLKGLNENYFNEELHVKLIKNYFKLSESADTAVKEVNIHKAVRHILNVEHNSLFSTSPAWYTAINDAIETSMTNSYFNDENQYDILQLVNLIVQYRQILCCLQGKPSQNLDVNLQESPNEQIEKNLDLFFKFDNALFVFDDYLAKKKLSPAKNLGSILPYQLTALNEVKAQFQYICGLFVTIVSKLLIKPLSTHLVNVRPTTPMSDTDSLSSMENYDCVSNLMLSNVCMAKSSLSSKPNNKENFQESIEKLTIINKSPKTSSQVSMSVMGLLQLVHQDSSVRFSIVGNWLKLQATKSTNEIKFLKGIKVYSRISNLCQTIAETIGFERFHREGKKSFLLDCKRFRLDIEDSESFYVIDSLCLEYADKQALLNQSSNLNYLVWHTMIRSQIEKAKICNKNLIQIHKCLPYLYLRNPNINNIKFGIDNFNMCNLESVSLIDMKLFLFSATVQAIYLNSKQNATTVVEVNIEPFWLQKNICNQKQLNWWTSCNKYIFNRRNLSKYSSSPQVKKDQTPLTIEALEATYKFSIEIKQQIELAKVLELLRLKNSMIKCLDLDSQETEKYQVNLLVCIELAKYLQRIVDQLKSKSEKKSLKMASLRAYLNAKVELAEVLQRATVLLKEQTDKEEESGKERTGGDKKESATDFYDIDCEQDFSPHEKLEYLKGISIQYWKYITKQLIKLKQLKRIDSQASMEDSRNFSIFNDSTLGSRTSTFNSPNTYRSHQTKCYFEFNEINRLNGSSEIDGYDLCDDSEDVDHLEEEQRQQDMIIQVGLLNLTLACLEACQNGEEDGSDNDGDYVNEIDCNNQLVMTKLKEAIDFLSSIEMNVDEKVKNEMNSGEICLCKQILECAVVLRKFFTEGDSSILKDIDIVIELMKKKINAFFKFKKGHLRPVEVATYLQSKTEEDDSVDLDRTIEETSAQISEIQLKDEKKTESEPVNMEELRAKIKEELCEEMKANKEYVAEINAADIEEIRAKIKEELRFDQQKLKIADTTTSPSKLAKTQVTSMDIFSSESKDVDARTQKTSEEEIAAVQLSIKQNEKIVGLIEILNQQRIAHLNFNTEQIQEQFQHIGSQIKKINSEIKKFSQSREKRYEILNDFRQIVKSFMWICDQEIYAKQFNVFFWLFQQQFATSGLPLHELNPNYLQAFTNQFYEYLEKAKQNELHAYKQQQIQQAIFKSPQKQPQSMQENSPGYSNLSKPLFQFPQAVQNFPKPDSLAKKNISTKVETQFLTQNIVPDVFTASISQQISNFKNQTSEGDVCNLDYDEEDGEEYDEENGEEYDEEDGEEYDEEDGEEYDEEYDEDYEDDGGEYDDDYEHENKENSVVHTGLVSNLSQSKCDTFQSCNENSQLNNSTHINDSSFKSFNDSLTSPDNGQNSQLSRSSIKDLEILFDSNARFYTYNPENSLWCLQGDTHIQVIADDGLSKSGVFQSYILCNLIHKSQTIQYNINTGSNFKTIVNSTNALSWFDTIDSKANLSKALSETNRCGAVLFERISEVNELKKSLTRCLSKISVQASPSFTSQTNSKQNKWSPPDQLPSLKMANNILRKVITFSINEHIFNDVALTISDFKDRNLSTSSFLASFDQNGKIMFQHAIRLNQKFEIIENSKQNKFICKYNTSTDEMMTDNLNFKLKNPLAIQLVFSAKLALSDFLNLFDH